MDYIGAHMSIAGGIYKAPERGKETGCGVIQVFTQNTNQWKGKMPSTADVELFRRNRDDAGLNDVISHDIYLVNLAALPSCDLYEKSITAFKEEMERCEKLGIDKIVMHPGSHLGEGETVGIARVAAAFDRLFSESAYTGKILLELTAGQGSYLGFRFEHLRDIIGATSNQERFGVCYDTCHTLAAGYDITTQESYTGVFEEFDRVLGIQLLMAFHMNDSKKGLNSHVDRHEHIGDGCLGLEPFRLLVNDPRFEKIPKILETPKKADDGSDMDPVNLARLRGLVKK